MSGLFLCRIFLHHLTYLGVMGLFLPTHDVPAQKAYGYYTKGDSIYFEFQQHDYNYVITRDDAKVVPMHLITCYETIFVAGVYQQNSHLHPMQQIDSVTYRIAFPLDSLEKDDWAFTFLINGYYWVEPPKNAINRLKSTASQDESFTTLFHKETYNNLALDSAALEDAMRVWLRQQGIYVPDTNTASMQSMQDILSTAKAVGIGRPEKDSLETLPVRFGLTRFLMAEMDFRLVAFEINRRTNKQFRDYLSGDSILFNDDYVVEMFNIIEWEHFHENPSIQHKLQYMLYQEEDVLSSLQVLQAFASKTDTALQQNINTLHKEISSLLSLQQIMGLYYYESPSYQSYLMELIHEISAALDEPTIDRREKTIYRVNQAVRDIKNYLSQLQDLKGYYQSVEKQLAQYFNWLEDLQLQIKFLVWVDNLEVSKSQPGTVGHYLSQKYGQQYIAIGVGSYDFDQWKEDSTLFSLELPFAEALKNKSGTQAFIIDLRAKELSQEAENWLAEKIYLPKNPGIPYGGNLKEEFDVVILVDQ